jgi:hypothetical protein
MGLESELVLRKFYKLILVIAQSCTLLWFSFQYTAEGADANAQMTDKTYETTFWNPLPENILRWQRAVQPNVYSVDRYTIFVTR